MIDEPIDQALLESIKEIPGLSDSEVIKALLIVGMKLKHLINEREDSEDIESFLDEVHPILDNESYVM